jgi:aminopeptidase N
MPARGVRSEDMGNLQRAITGGCGAALLGLAVQFGASASAQPSGNDIGTAATEREQVPTNVVPLHYDLSLHPDADRLVFSGEARIAIQASASVSVIVLNAKGLVFDDVRLEDGRKAVVTLDRKLEQASLRIAGGVTAGRHTLDIRYHGAIGRGTLGFFAMDYETPSGKRRTLATNFEPVSERMLMPSWDEPGYKATFSVTVDTPADRMAVGNMPVESETRLPHGLKRVRFATTPKMSTYLLFLAIGDYERVFENTDGVQVGVVVAKGEAEKGRYALKEATRLLHYYNDYFGVPYPLPKLDLVAAPGEIEGDSMENWGAIFYSQQHVLFDSKNSTEADRQSVFLVVSHEMSHQWFGDLVTMNWWDNLWLNEGFARWMQTKAADDLHPEWETDLQASSITEQGMRADAKASTHAVEQPVRSAAEAELAFDEITYDKGAAVIGMLEGYVGADRFRDGVRRYMREHAYGNTASADLWRALQSAAGKPLQGIADDFTRRPGLPLVTVESERQVSGTLQTEVIQSRFLEAHESGVADPAVAAWRLPLAIKPVVGEEVATLLLDAERGTASVSGSGPALVNAGRTSYARVRYLPTEFADLAARFGALMPADQIGMLQDAWALGQSEYAPITNVLRLVAAMPLDTNPIVWARAIRLLVAIDGLYDGLPGQAAYRRWARSRLMPVATRLGWDQSTGETPGVSLLRGPILLALGRFGDPAVIAEARRLDAAAAADPGSQSAAVRRIAREVVAHNADAATFDKIVEKLRATLDPLEKGRLLDNLTRVADPVLAERALELVIGPDAPSGTMPNLLLKAASEHPDLTWSFARSHVDAPGFPMDRATRMYVLPGIPSYSADPRRAQELRDYAAAHLPAAATRPVQAAIAQIELNARIRARGMPQIDDWLVTDQPPVHGR